MSLWFVTPAWRRYELSAVCFDQRADVIRKLGESGIEAHCVVVADDDNLALAQDRGFETVKQSNEFLGRKFNDGMEYAARRGAEWIVPIGSDSWIDPAYFSGLIPRVVRTSGNYCAVTADEMAVLSVQDGKGAGPYVFPRRLLSRAGFRPAVDIYMKHIDSSTVRGIQRSTCAPVPWSPSYQMHPYQYIGFRGTPHITPYERLVERWGVRIEQDPWATLAEHYPSELVERARQALTVAVAA